MGTYIYTRGLIDSEFYIKNLYKTNNKIMKTSSIILAAALLMSPQATLGFKFMSNMKIAPPIDDAAEAKFGNKKLVVLTGTSSGLGRKTAQALLRTGEYHVIGAVRDIDKMEVVAEMDGFDLDNFTPMHVELNSFESVKKFCQDVRDFKTTKPLDRLICNAGIYQPTLPYAKWSADGHEQTMQTNYLSHLLMISELIEEMTDSPDLKNLDGFEAGFDNPIAMADG